MVTAVVTFVFADDAQVSAQSIWKQRRVGMSNLTSDTAARHVGDLVTIIVSEATDVANRDNRQLGKSADASFNLDFSSSGDLGSGAGAMDISKESDRNFSGNSQVSVAQELTDRITVEILDVLPNGNFVLGGKRQRLVAGETRTLVVTGWYVDWTLAPTILSDPSMSPILAWPTRATALSPVLRIRDGPAVL